MCPLYVVITCVILCVCVCVGGGGGGVGYEMHGDNFRLLGGFARFLLGLLHVLITHSLCQQLVTAVVLCVILESAPLESKLRGGD